MGEHAGQRLGNYRLIRLLGRGGFAEVYLGEHVYLNNYAAIKVLYTHLTEEDSVSFLTEARTLVRLVHPHIVRLLDFGVEDTMPFLVMDYALHGSLRQRHPRGEQLPLPTIINYVNQVADALQYAHEEKLIHRDIKPENMLLGRRQEVLLSDFGIAVVAQSSRYERTQDTTGTIAYMAPEQIQAHPRPASDQYALGVVVYEWLAGDRPFHGSFSEIAAKQLFTPPPPLHEKVPTIPSLVEQVVMTALAKDPKQRFDSIQAFATALEQAYRSTMITANASSVPPPSITLPTESAVPTEGVASSNEPSGPAEVDKPRVQAPVTSSADPLLSQSAIPTELIVSPHQTAIQPTKEMTSPDKTSRTPDLDMSSEPLPQSTTTALPIDQPASISDSAEVQKEQARPSRKRHLARILIGTLLFGIASFLFSCFTYNLGLIPFTFIPLTSTVVVPLFFGVVFGPLEGLCLGGIGCVLGECLFFLAFKDPNFLWEDQYAFWFIAGSIALAGLVASLAWFRTQGYYHTKLALLLAINFSILGIEVMSFVQALPSSILTFSSSSLSFSDKVATFFSFLLPPLVSALPGLILLPLLLVVVRGRERPLT
jgi:serine/threonine protein kinase